ncbi:MAG: tRNA pseudouridine(38-40) synthase TruA [Terrimesophilobacter sp.]
MATGIENSEHGDDTAMTRVRLDISYDGTRFHGWGRQPQLRTVQGVLEDALATIFGRLGEPPTLTVAGRTDAGVHALGQVAHLDLTEAQLVGFCRNRAAGGAAAIAQRLNGIAGLDTDVWVCRSSIAPPGFDARFSATWRQYEYRVADAHSPRNPLHRMNTLWYPASLDVFAMNEAAGTLAGLHDWTSFCRSREGTTNIRTLQVFTWERDSSGVLVAQVKADAFCHSMVRALVGATIAVGEAKLAPAQLLEIRAARERTSDFKVVPSKGLTLVEVGYPDDAGLAARAEQTRARREPLTEPE